MYMELYYIAVQSDVYAPVGFKASEHFLSLPAGNELVPSV